MNQLSRAAVSTRPKKPSDSASYASLRASYKAREKGDRQFVEALARGLAILRSFRAGDRYLTNQEIARRTGLPKPTISRLTHTLTATGFLSYSVHRDEYALGVGVLALGHAYLAALNIRELARPMMQEMAEFSRGTISLGEPDAPHMVILEICHGNSIHRLRVDIGERLPYGTTALGRAHLAGLAPEQREAQIQLIAKRLPAESREESCENIRRSLRAYDKSGFTLSCGDWKAEVVACGVPLVSHDGARILALSCSATTFEMSRKRLIAEIAPRMIGLRDRILAATQGYF